jgi:hypothetical protein
MHSTALTIGWVRDLPKLAPGAQERALLAYGILAHDIVVDGRRVSGRSREDWPWLLKKLRPGDTLAVVKLRAIYTPHGNSPSKSILRAVHAIEDHGCRILEISTGLRSWMPRERDKMIAACREVIALSRKGGDAGRPAREWSKAEREIVMRHWHSTEHATNAAAFAAIKADAKAAGLTALASLRHSTSIGNSNAFGPSGRGRLKPKSKNR